MASGFQVTYFRRSFNLESDVAVLRRFQIEYISDVQLGFLRMLNTEAQQTFVYHCRRSTAWHDARGSDRLAISLLGDNDAEINTDRLHDFEVVDGCSVRVEAQPIVFE